MHGSYSAGERRSTRIPEPQRAIFANRSQIQRCGPVTRAFVLGLCVCAWLAPFLGLMSEKDDLQLFHAKGTAPGQEAAEVVAEVLAQAGELR